jgi:hypothetical protein
VKLVVRDKWSREWDELIALQRAQLEQLETVLKPGVYADLKQWCEQTNRRLTAEEENARLGRAQYTAGGLHVCPVGQELFHYLQKYGTGTRVILDAFRSRLFAISSRDGTSVKPKRQS